MKFDIRVWPIILKISHIENKEKFRDINIWMFIKFKFIFWILKKDNLLEFLKIIHTCKRMCICIYCMSILQISLSIIKITNNIVNHIDFYEDCLFKIPIL